MTDGLRAAIDDVYRAFSGYVRPASFEACACCWAGEPLDADDGRNGRGSVRVAAPGGGMPLRSLTATDLANVAADIPLTAGTLEVRKHYLPRILELAVNEGFDWPDLEVVFYRLNDDERVGSSPWTAWPTAEQTALRRFFRALWLHRIEEVDADDDGHRVDDALCAIGVVETDLGWYLDAWTSSTSPASVRNLRAFLVLNDEDLAKGELWNAYWEADPPADVNAATVVRWAKQRQRDLSG
jgi:hypothetical protein